MVLRCLALVAAVALPAVPAIATVPASESGEIAAVLAAVRASEIDPQRAVSVANLDLDLGPATFAIERGRLVPATGVDGRTAEFVFLGEARFRLAPPDEIEAGQLELFSGSSSLDETVREAVLVLGDPDLAANLAAGPAAGLTPDETERARTLFSIWTSRPERRAHGAEGALVRAALEDPPYEGYVGLWCRGERTGTFFFQVDPDEVEPVTLGQFVPHETDRWSRRRLGARLRAEQRAGRWLDLRVEDLGYWDVWLSSAPAGEDGAPAFGDQGIEPREYRLDVTIDPADERIDAVAGLDIVLERSGRRVLAFVLHRDLTVERVRDRLGRTVPHVRVGDEILVELPEPTRAGERLELEFVYGGHILQKTGRREYVLRNTSRWYPRCGVLDRARYDLELRWPRKFDVVASGRLVDRGVEDGMRRERRRLDLPGIAVSFEVGEFLVTEERVGHVDLTVAFSRRTARELPPSARRDTVRAIRETLTFFQAVFGPYPLGEMTVVTVPRDYSQAFLGFTTLSDRSLAYDGPRAWKARRPQREKTIAHEVAHQWWGNLIGWRNYRDQWLSEAMANYAALLYLDYRAGGISRDYLAELAAGWRDSLGLRLKDGRTVEAVGPMILGERLNSSKTDDAYNAIVYRKGAVVLAMLARTFDERQFLGMLRALSDVAQNRVLSTESFLKAMEHMSGRDLSEFSSRYVYGTGIPDVFYEWRIEPGADDDRPWVVRGRAEQFPSVRAVHRAVALPGGTWDVLQEVEGRVRDAASELIVPVRVELEPVEIERRGSRRKAGRSRRAPAAARLEGVVRMRGDVHEFEIPLPGRPRTLELDPRGEILANFYSETDAPKRVLYRRATALRGTGRRGEVEDLLRRALARPLAVAPAGEETERRRTQEERLLDARIRIDLVRVLTDDGRDAEAERELRVAERDLGALDRGRFELEFVNAKARLELRRGNARAALQRLRRLEDLLETRSSFVSWRQYWLYLQVQSRSAAAAELAALHATAARLAGDDDEYARARVEAEERGCDLSALDEQAR